MVDNNYTLVKPTHRCKICGAYWKEWHDSWSLTSVDCGKCCDNVEMGDQIAKLEHYSKQGDLIKLGG